LLRLSVTVQLSLILASLADSSLFISIMSLAEIADCTDMNRLMLLLRSQGLSGNQDYQHR
jgi:hypothetical protein